MSRDRKLGEILRSAVYRPMPWRENLDPYWIFVSEVMLQQTQVDRVIPKFHAFIHAFPTLHSLATATLPEVLSLWSGLGYNRRAMWLWESAQAMHNTHGCVPPDPAYLQTLKGIGKHTAHAICVYAFNMPLVFVETNVRTVCIHEFFPDRDDVRDEEIVECVERELDREHPRQWYWAVMDYGAYLKKHTVNPSRRSKHHVKQSAFVGSDRQVRGHVLKTLLHTQSIDAQSLAEYFDRDATDGERILNSMCKDGLLVRDVSTPTYRLRA